MLKEALDVYTRQRFEAEFGYKYANNPPTSLRALDVTGAMLGRNSNVCYIPDLKVEDLKNYIDKQVFKYVFTPRHPSGCHILPVTHPPCRGINLNMPSIRGTSF